MDYAQVLEQVKEWACSLIILQYRQAPKNRELIRMLVDLIFANNLILQVRDKCLNVEQSEGVQLDVIGQWVGLDRYYNGIDLWLKNNTSLMGLDNISKSIYPAYSGGFSTYENFADNDGGFITYKRIKDVRASQNQMGDSYYRELIKLKIIKNSIEYTCKNIDDAIYTWSGGDIYTTWQPMQVTYHFPKAKSDIITLALYKKVLLAPTGVQIITAQY